MPVFGEDDALGLSERFDDPVHGKLLGWQFLGDESDCEALVDDGVFVRLENDGQFFLAADDVWLRSGFVLAAVVFDEVVTIGAVEEDHSVVLALSFPVSS